MVIVDVFNVLHAAPRSRPGLKRLTVDLLAALAQSSRFSGQGIVLVCDGTAGGRVKAPEPIDPSAAAATHSGVLLVAAGAGRDADSYIEAVLEVLERHKRASTAIVVSDDQRLRAAATGVRARRLSAADFLETLARDAAKHAGSGHGSSARPGAGLDPDSTRAWLREFGLSPDGSPATSQSDDECGERIDLDDLENLDTGQWLDQPPHDRPD